MHKKQKICKICNNAKITENAVSAKNIKCNNAKIAKQCKMQEKMQKICRNLKSKNLKHAKTIKHKKGKCNKWKT